MSCDIIAGHFLGTTVVIIIIFGHVVYYIIIHYNIHLPIIYTGHAKFDGRPRIYDVPQTSYNIKYLLVYKAKLVIMPYYNMIQNY